MTQPEEPAAEPPPARPQFAELAVTTNFSFLRGGSHPEELVAEAARVGLVGMAVADRNTLAGVVRGYVMLKEIRKEFPDFRYAVGCRLAFRDGTPDIFAWPTDRAAWGRLCRLLTTGNLRAVKGECHLDFADLLAWGEGMILGVMPGIRPDERLKATVRALRDKFPSSVCLMANFTYGGDDQRRLTFLARAARRLRVPLMATNDVHYHVPERRPLQDVLTCIREKTTIAAAGYRLAANAERYMKSPEEMARLFRDYPEAVTETVRVLERLTFSLDELSRHQYPDETFGDAASPQEALERLAEAGAAWRYPGGVPEKIRENLENELKLIAKLQYAPYFLTVRHIMEYARSKDILCQGRGSAANSTVCYCLRITEVDPSGESGGLFERFVSAERGEPPDIDVDFEHERREEVMQYVYEKYTREHAGIAATVITYRTRSAVRDIGKVFGLSEDTVSALASTTWGWSSEGVPDEDVRRAGLDPSDRTMQHVLRLCRELIGFPRHLSQHVGGFVITRDRLDEIVPVMKGAMKDRTHVEWAKDDLDALRILKVDVLALGMLTCIQKAFKLLHARYGEDQSIAKLMPSEEKSVYRMLCRADSLGVFQVESRAQMSMLPRLRPEKFYDLVIEVAIVRPGPIQGGMVHPYLRRKQELERVTYPTPVLEDILGKTLGVPLFQEQAMRIAIECAGFAPGEADEIRRAMATFRRVGTIHQLRERFVTGMKERKYDKDFAERCFSQIEGFGDYGFPESHAASFAILVYVSAWLKCHYPDVFCAALLNSQPMGFYAPAQLVRDAERHGVLVLPPDVNYSDWYTTLEETPDAAACSARLHPTHAEMSGDIRTRYAVRLGLHRIKGMRKEDAESLMQARGRGYDSVRDLWLRTGIDRAGVERLADGDAFRSIGLDRRDALWAARGESAVKTKDRLPLFDVPKHADIRREPDFALPPMPIGEHIVNDYRYLSLSLKAHPLSFLRRHLAARGIVPNSALRATSNGARLTIAGLVIIRQRPGTAKGVIFMTLEDESDIANAIVWPKTFERFRPVVLGARLVAVTGRVQSANEVIHVVAERIDDLTPMLAVLSEDADDLASLAHGDEVARPTGDDSRQRHPRNVRFFQKPPERTAELAAIEAHRVMPKGRNFH